MVRVLGLALELEPELELELVGSVQAGRVCSWRHHHRGQTTEPPLRHRVELEACGRRHTW